MPRAKKKTEDTPPEPVTEIVVSDSLNSFVSSEEALDELVKKDGSLERQVFPDRDDIWDMYGQRHDRLSALREKHNLREATHDDINRLRVLQIDPNGNAKYWQAQEYVVAEADEVESDEAENPDNGENADNGENPDNGENGENADSGENPE